MAAANVIAAILFATAPVSTADPNAPLNACVQRTAAVLPQVARDTLARIDGLPRQVLALRSYVRAKDLASRWSWSDKQMAAYEHAPEHAAALAALARVQANFAAHNPGVTLFINTEVRSLDVQLAHYNANTSVATVAAALVAEAAAVCTRMPEKFASWLAVWKPPFAANLAAPGLSPHGQARAFDFQIYRGNDLVAGTSSGQIADAWVGQGWAAKLAAAIAQAGPEFTGPLQSPNEPWHYTYAKPSRPTRP